ncbi:stemmadenine O-acetyltransferase-like [Tripterygium wilfordii]|uniref:stemmadenine O-acetyltransferase-like n=1 Tax=Tripterygium wilfordii TaxID=458696 RepID=UPI0018F7F6DD|nr:stemmadenine O-acetyltransferase-like [Tripterygium wilfordii]
MSNKSSKAFHPNFDTLFYFPPVDAFPKEATFSAIFSQFSRTDKCALRRFVFDASAVARLKAEAASSGVQNPTRVELVTAILWKTTMSALEAKAGIRRPHLVTHGVNLRRRAVPEFPESLVGNLFKLDKVIKEMITGAAPPGGLLEYTSFDSWCNLGLYTVDFGWGNPWWISCVPVLDSSATTSFTNRIFLMDSRPSNGDCGVEAWAYIEEEEMAILENEMELLALGSMDSSPIESCKL